MLLVLNFAVLLVWTILDPLVYTIEPHDGTDGWNRVISTYGSCQSDDAFPYLFVLMLVNMGVLVIANWQAYRARNLQSEFAESKYIGLILGSMLQATIMGIPILFIVRENPQAFYLLLVFTIFFICLSCLLFIFAPKMVFAELFKQKNPEEQARFIREAIRTASTITNRRSSAGLNASTDTEKWNTTGSFDGIPTSTGRRQQLGCDVPEQRVEEYPQSNTPCSLTSSTQKNKGPSGNSAQSTPQHDCSRSLTELNLAPVSDGMQMMVPSQPNTRMPAVEEASHIEFNQGAPQKETQSTPQHDCSRSHTELNIAPVRDEMQMMVSSEPITHMPDVEEASRTEFNEGTLQKESDEEILTVK